MVYLSGLLLLAAVLAVFGGRQHQQIQEEADSKLRTNVVFRVHDAGKYQVSRSHVNDLCTAAVVKQCVLLVAPPQGGRAWTGRLAEVLAADESEVVAMLEALGVEVKDDFGCREFCEASAVHIPGILRTAAPGGPEKGCIDDACRLPTADVSHDALVHEGLQSPPPSAPGQVDELEEKSNMTVPPVLDPEVRGAMLFRAALNIVFGIFPAVGEADDETSVDGLPSSLMQDSTEEITQRPLNQVAFGPRTLRSRHDEYRQYAVTAAAWIAAALRNIDAGKSVVAKWLITQGGVMTIENQVEESRRHLRLMLDGMQYLQVRKGKPEVCTEIIRDGQVVGGTVAYVFRYQNCVVTSYRACGVNDQQGRHIINICEYYWDRSNSGSTRVGTFVHECSHHYGTTDQGYCDQVDCLRLPSAKARSNADTYTKLVEELTRLQPGVRWKAPDTGRRRPTENSMTGSGSSLQPGPLKPHPHCNTACGDTTFDDFRFNTKLYQGHCGQCEVLFRGIHSCHNRKRMATSTFLKVCCHTHVCSKGGMYVG